jgi:glycosyltransferase involved in cell wall biosynthesis
MRIALIAPPWLGIPPKGYGGIENVIAALVPALIKQKHEVELFTVKTSTIKSSKNHRIYETEQYEHIHKPVYESLPILAAHSAFAINKILEDSSFDVVHSHNGFIDPLIFNFIEKNFPPVVHTLHGPPFTTQDRLDIGLPDNLAMWKQLGKSNKLFYVPISNTLASTAPNEIKSKFLEPVYNGIDITEFPFEKIKQDYVITLARIHPDKGQKIAIDACLQTGIHLKLAGPLGDIGDPIKAISEAQNINSPNKDLTAFKYFRDEILPNLNNPLISFVGDVKGKDKLNLICNAKALLFPIQWDEPFGMAPIEALACGTPVISMAKGALTEIIDHGVNGFLANSVEEFGTYLDKIDQINPEDCRKSVELKVSSEVMAQGYIKRYLKAIELAKCNT